ncbi:MAG: hypothetical protein RL154_1197, partial [Pseudomonadota bacterium]
MESRYYIKSFILTLFCITFSFANQDFNGSIVFYDTNTSKYSIINEADANTRFSPCSTFKILNSVISLDSGAVKDEKELIAWDGINRPYNNWNQDT